MLLDQEFPFSIRLELIGFSKKEITKYAKTVLSAEDAAKFNQQVEDNKQLQALLNTPINCVNACRLFRSGTKKATKHPPCHDDSSH